MNVLSVPAVEGRSAVKQKGAFSEGLTDYFFLLLLIVVAFAPWATHFVGLASGNGEFTSGLRTLHGHPPILESYSVAPPFNAFKSVLELRVFGEHLLVTRLCGLTERALLGLLLYKWLRRSFTASIAFVAAFVTIVAASCDMADPLASYNHDAILLAMLAGYAATLSVAKAKINRRYAFAAGLSAGLAMTCKQTVGGGTWLSLGFLMVLLLAMRRQRRDAGLWTLFYGAGSACPILLLSVWLQAHGRLYAVMHMMFVEGPSAKAGSFADFFLRAWHVAVGNLPCLVAGSIGFLLAVSPMLRSMRGGSSSPSKRILTLRRAVAGSAMIVIVAICLSLGTNLPALWDFAKAAIYFLYFGLPFAVVYLALRFKKLKDDRNAGLLILGVTSLVVAVTLGLSWPAFEAMLLPGLGLLLALLLDGVRRMEWFALLVIAAVLFLPLRERYDRPFGFNDVTDGPVRLASAAMVSSYLEGIRVSPEEARFIDSTVQTVKEHTTAGQTIFTYPEMNIFYALTGRQPPTRAESHNVDVMNDAMAREEAERLLQHPPQVLIWYPKLAEEQRLEDLLWRGGRRSGQWEIQAAVEKLSNQYKLVGAFPVAPNPRPVLVYVKPEDLSQKN